LTKDEIALCHHIDASGNENSKVFQLAYNNAFHQSGKKNSIDLAILRHITAGEKDINMGKLIAEIPFNFESRRSSSIVETATGKKLLICKGAFEEVFALCTHIRIGNGVIALNEDHGRELISRAANFNDDGYRVILVAIREIQSYELDEEQVGGLDTRMTIEGLLTFLDPPKDDAKASIQRLQDLKVDVRVLTGDNLGVALKVCRTLNLVQEVDEGEIQAITGPELARIEDTDTFARVVKHCKVFAKLTPTQKGQVIMSLKNQGEVVGMLGDGINDCVALRFADAGISVDSGMNVAKDCADIILTQKELSIIVDCVLTGRITHGNRYHSTSSSTYSPATNLHLVSNILKWSPPQVSEMFSAFSSLHAGFHTAP
jgi:P-type Mg2+ transporter